MQSETEAGKNWDEKPGGRDLRSVIEASDHLGRFMGKLLSEAYHLQATQVIFSRESNDIAVSLLKDKLEIKSLEIRSSWFESVLLWLHDRTSIFSDSYESSLSLKLNETEIIFDSAVRIGETVMQFRVSKQSMLSGKQRIVLSNFTNIALSHAVERAGFRSVSRLPFEQILAETEGVIVLVGRDASELRKAEPAILSLTGCHHTKLTTLDALVSEREILKEAAKNHPLLVTLHGVDSLEVLHQLRFAGISLDEWPITGIVVWGTTPRICTGCAKPSVIETRFLTALPDFIRPHGDGAYQIGRGCASCGHSGYRGVIGLQSVLSVDPALRHALECGINGEKLIEHAWNAGTRPLLDDGIHKALEGVLSFESLFNVVQQLPALYPSFYRRLAESQQSKESNDATLKLHAAGSHVMERPLSGRDVFNSRPSPDEPKLDRPTRERPQVLIVEDDADQRAILELVFKGSNYDIRLAKDGIEGLKEVERETPDLIISDLMMPNMDGIQFVGHLKAHPVFRRIPILILTVISDTNKEYDLLSLGADDYCEKTIQRKILLKRVEKLIDRGPIWKRV